MVVAKGSSAHLLKLQTWLRWDMMPMTNVFFLHQLRCQSQLTSGSFSLSFLLCLLSPSFLCLSFFGEQLSRWSLPVLSLSSLSSRSYLSYLSSLSLSIEEKELQQCPSKMVLIWWRKRFDLLGQVNHAMELNPCWWVLGTHQVHYLQLLLLAQLSSCLDLPRVGYAAVRSNQ